MAAIIGHDRPEVTALGGLSARIEHRRAGFIDEDAVGAAQMGAHVVDDRHEVELRGTVAPVGRRKPPKRAADPVAERTAIEVDPLPLEDFGLVFTPPAAGLSRRYRGRLLHRRSHLPRRSRHRL